MTAINARRRLMWVAGYALLLLISFIVRTSRHETLKVPPGVRVATVNSVNGTRVGAAAVRLAYLEADSAAVADAGRGREPVVLLHGSPGRKEDFNRLLPVLAKEFRVVAPDLPGFGGSTHEIPDYSFRAHAVYVRQLLDALGIASAHVVGFSMGGGVALSLADQTPARVASLTLLSAIGVQEMELTGDYYVNHAVHGVQLAALWGLIETTPHMGFLDGGMMDLGYARNFFDSDQRPLRGILQRLPMPVLIVHGRNDHLVPYDAAMEHYRLVPQSELVTFEADHFLAFQQAADIGTAIREFIARAIDNRAPVRSQADPARVLEARDLYPRAALPRVRGMAAAVFAAILTTGSILVPPLANTAAGMFLARGRVSPLLALGSCLFGAGLGQVLRIGWLRRGDRPLRQRTVREHRRSLVSAAVQTALWVAASAAISWILFLLTPLESTTSTLGVAATIALVVGIIRLARASSSERGRRLLVSSWRRATKWEFWPPWLFYPPVAVYVGYLMLKHRSPTLFTAANPSIVAGGFIGESKIDILRGLASAGEFVARATLIDGSLSPTEKRRVVDQFMSAEQLALPIVLKPNYGQRGSGVVVVRSEKALDACVRQSSVDTIVQEYVEGEEFGVFYYRLPSQSHGKIFSVTEKTFPTVVGDGQRTLEQLILHDERAVCAAQLYLERHRDALANVVNNGEVFALAELGTHCRGAVFLDGARVITPALEARFDAIAKRFDGFYFGRFDVRLTGGVDTFRAGTGFKVIELNGVTSEATHIYHPGTPLLGAYRVLIEQWRIAFDIGDENRRRGVEPTPLRLLAALTWEYRRTARGHLGERPMRDAVAGAT